MSYVDVNTSGGPSPDNADSTGPPTTPRPTDAEMKLVTTVTRRWAAGQQELMLARRHYWENLAFFMGEQYTRWDSARNQLQALSNSYSPLGAGKARLVVNRIEPNIINVLARMLATPLGFEVPPTASGDDVLAGAKLGEDVLEANYHDQNWGSVRLSEMMDALLGGVSAVSVEWDGSGGDQLEIDESTNRVVGTGDVRLRSHSIAEFCVEPGVTDARRARWWICGLSMPPREVQSTYGLAWVPEPDATALLSPLQYRILNESGRPQGGNQTLVLCCYERPNPETPKGQYVVVVNNRVVHQADWPFPFSDRLNMVAFRQEAIPGKWTGWTYVNNAIKTQYQYNFMLSNIAELFKKVGMPRMIAPQGAFSEDDFDDDPGSILFYEPGSAGGAKPEFVSPPSMPGWIAEEVNRCEAQMDLVMHVSATSSGTGIGERASGQALALLSEKDDSPLGLMGTEQAEGWATIAEMVLALYAKNATETRTIAVRGPANTPNIRKFTGAMLHGQTRVYVDPDTTKPVSKAAMQSFAKDLWDRQIITDPGMYARISQLPSSALEDVIDADVAKAQHENGLMAMAVPVVPEAFDDHPKHIAEHNRARKGRAYQYADPIVRHIYDQHVQAHEVMEHEQLGEQTGRAMESPSLAAVAQANEPPGSMVPPDFAETQAGLAGDPTAPAIAPGGGGPPQAGGMPPTLVPPGPQVGPPPEGPDFGPAGTAPGLTNGAT